MRRRGRHALEAALTEAILADLRAQAALTGPRRLHSIFLGGGTPSLMAPDDAGRLIKAAQGLWPADADLEITLEANPADATPERLAAFAGVGVNRLSLGVQSFDDAELAWLGRDHDARTADAAARAALEIFPRVSLDLICALPGQSTAAWLQTLRQAVALGPEHISAYELTVEPGTALSRAVARGTAAPLDETRRAQIWEATQEALGAAGFEAYEVSNHARGVAARSRHNLVYWRGQDYVGVGPGAHGRLTRAGRRLALETPRRLADYIAAAQSQAPPAVEALSPRDAALERLLMGLRTIEGVPMSELEALAIPQHKLAGIATFVTVQDDRLVATAQGRAVLDAVVLHLSG